MFLYVRGKSSKKEILGLKWVILELCSLIAILLNILRVKSLFILFIQNFRVFMLELSKTINPEKSLVGLEKILHSCKFQEAKNL